MKFSDDFFNKVEKKTNVDKDTIVSLANKLQNGNLKDESTLRDVINTLSTMTGRSVSEEQTNKIIDTVIHDKVPNNINKFYE